MKSLEIGALRVLCLVVWQIGFAPKASSANANVNHLVPVSETGAEAYQAKIYTQLSVTPADIAQMIVCPAWEPEFAVSVYSDPPTSNDDIVRYHVTVTRAATSIWYSSGAVEIRRSDAELPASAALPVKEVWKQMLLSARPYKNPVDLPVDGETVEFALSEPNQSALRGELPVNPARDILALQNLGTLLVDYGQAIASEQKTLANQIEKTAKRLLKKKPDLDVAPLQGSLRISPRERERLKQRANQGDPKAAERLSLYYSIYRSDRRRVEYYLKLAAKNNSDVAIRSLMTLYSTDALLFDFRKALTFREKLKNIAETQEISLKSDADWGYERFLDQWRAGEKKRGLYFLEYAAQHGAGSAPKELIGLYSKDPSVRNPERARYWRRLDASKLPTTETLAVVGTARQARLGSSIDDFLSLWGRYSEGENLGRTSNLKWNPLPNGESIVPGVFALEAAFLDGIACEITLRSKQRITGNKLRQLAKLFLTSFRDSDFEKPKSDFNGFLVYQLSDGTFVSVNEHAGHRVIVFTGQSYILNESVFDREAAKVRPPTSNP